VRASGIGSGVPAPEISPEDYADREHDRELDEMIRMGWGGVDQYRIPADWRTRRGPERENDGRNRARSTQYARDRSEEYRRRGRSRGKG
jgi:hypothetical protein